ncbi:MAG: hypothetical protein IJK83_03985 [Clostridiales bacterium]|nr:hypothetical protein [Clostridiales bacterium]MBR2821033.1 hypothetical protein [Clostridiales bacterium]
MPHSSGGGSHSGGSHSSSSSSSSGGGSGSGSSRRTSNQPFKGATRYLYYKDQKPYFIYSNYDIRKKNMSPFIITVCFFIGFFLPFLIGMAAGMVLSFHTPKKINYGPKNPEFVIEDNLGIFENPGKLEKSMKEFYKTTGIVPAVITVTNETWNEDYTSLENYAYDVYVNRFPDEVHWLIVYSEEIKPDGFNDWYWEGMQGDNTDPVLTEKHADAFTQSLHKRLSQRSKYSVDDAIAVTFDEYGPRMMKMSFETAQFVICLIAFIVLSLFAVLSFISSLKKCKVPEDYKDAKPCGLTAVYQEACGFCGGIYIIGMHTECPHCGAAIPPHHYIKDDQGNIVQLM